MAQSVEQFLAEFVDAFDGLHWDRFRSSFSERATVYFPFPDRPLIANGKAELEAGFKGFFDRLRATVDGPPYLNLNPFDLRVEDLGGAVLVTFHLDFPDSLGRRTVVLSDEDGSWKIVHLHASNTSV